MNQLHQVRFAHPRQQNVQRASSGERDRATSLRRAATSAQLVPEGPTVDLVATAERQKERGLPRRTNAVLVHERDRGVEDEEMACRSAATLLITASTRGEVETLARRIHQSSDRARAPFVPVRACTLPIEPRTLMESCSALLDAAPGGSLLMTDVEEMPSSVQSGLVELLGDLQSTRATSAVRLIAGTTVSLLDRIAAGTFSERLFYRLNLIHVMARDGAP